MKNDDLLANFWTGTSWGGGGAACRSKTY